MATDRGILENGRTSQKRPRTTAPKEVHEDESKSSRGPVSMILIADPDLLDCPICFQPLSSPVYQCGSGHIACASCCTTTLKNKCANCCLPIQNIRCRAIEKVIESVRVTCQYKPYGCTEIVSYSKKVDHEKACIFIPCSCPCCDFVATSMILYDHFAVKHMDSSEQFDFGSKKFIFMNSTKKHVILRERTEGVLFVLNRFMETQGNFFNVVCVAPPASKKILYELTAKIGDDSIKLKSSVEMMSKWTARTSSKMSLVVPSNFVSTSQLLGLDLVIGEKRAFPIPNLCGLYSDFDSDSD